MIRNNAIPRDPVPELICQILTARLAGTLHLADGMESGRIRDRIGTVIGALRPHANVPIVADLLDRAEAAQSQ